MLNRLLRRLTQDQDKPPEPEDCRRALTVLLVRVAKVDRVYSESERYRILNILRARYSLEDDRARELLDEAETIEQDALDTVQFTRILKDKVPYPERESLLEALWQVVLADDQRDHEEDSFLRLTTNLLGISDRNNALARQRVMNRMKLRTS